ncbi:MAG: translation initiation factor IF-2 subunit gamma [Candidatus Nanoarchaeia archaeon]|nr:translation initiation factor IF-2 subunit gamma [Candidatus Nanoarchaeia archaeon]MDD5054453.1 translation initiation factor IF-2 subunit gamma [Candidatus Nanoarchaeia archaeon]MDD5499420.1 translation initiation factor IF-2 subunit gamma [Candidatus Nanoarchaeia archaeon]
MKKDDLLPKVTIGMVGHIDHGKTTLLQKLTGKWADTHSEEMKRGITIKLGYASCTIYKCPKCKDFSAYSISKKCMTHSSDNEVLRTISFVDAPGHEALMATMLSGASMIHGAILVIAANEPCPQQQTKDHLNALEITGIKKIIIVQNKADLVNDAELEKNYEQIKAFIKGTVAENAPIIPLSGQSGANVDALLMAIEEFIPSPKINKTDAPIMLVARSFDINKPGKEISELNGTIIGGSLKQGVLKKNDEIIILPGFKEKNEWIPINARVESINYSNSIVDEVFPGGSFGISTSIDPYFGKNDKLSGSVACLKKKPLNVFFSLEFNYSMSDESDLKLNELLLLNIWAAKTTGIIKSVKKGVASVDLSLPVACMKNERIAISRKAGNRWKLAGWGEII